MPHSTPHTPPQIPHVQVHEPAPQRAGSADVDHGSPKSLASGLSSGSSSSSSSKTSHRRHSRSHYHDLDYLKTHGAEEGVHIVAGTDARDFVRQYTADPNFRSRTGPVVVARSAVNKTGRKVVDYARTWRGDVKAHRNKGPRKDLLADEDEVTAEDVIRDQLKDAPVPQEEADKHDEVLNRAVKNLDVAFKRMSLTLDEQSKSGQQASPDTHTRTHVDTTSMAPLKTLAVPRAPHSATASVQSIPFLGLLAEQQLRIVNPDPRSPSVESVDGQALFAQATKRSSHPKELTIVLIDGDDDREWNLKHPTPVTRRTPTQRKSKWNGPLATASSPSTSSPSPSNRYGQLDDDTPPVPALIPSGGVMPGDETRRTTPPYGYMQSPLPSNSHMQAHHHSMSQNQPIPLEAFKQHPTIAVDVGYKTQVPAYTAQSMYTPQSQTASPYTPSSAYTMLSPGSTGYGALSPANGYALLSPTNATVLGGLPPTNGYATMSPANGYTVLSPSNGGYSSLPQAPRYATSPPYSIYANMPPTYYTGA